MTPEAALDMIKYAYNTHINVLNERIIILKKNLELVRKENEELKKKLNDNEREGDK